MYSLKLKYAAGSIAFFMSGAMAFCQDSLALSSGSTTPGGTVTLSLALSSTSGIQPAGIQWTFAYPPSAVVAISASAGTAATIAGKSLSCAGTAGSYMCFLTGLTSTDLNANVIQNGQIAVLTVTMSATATGTTAISVNNALSTSVSGSAIQTNTSAGTINVGAPL